jgi:hypothetical protein
MNSPMSDLRTSRKLQALLGKLNALNPDVGISAVSDPGFGCYGRLLGDFSAAAIVDYLEATIRVTDDLVYQPDAIGMDRFPAETLAISQQVFAGAEDLQLGWTYGRNARLSSLEYHKCAEVVITATDTLVLLGLVQDIAWPDGTYDISRVQAFLVPSGTVYEVFPWCLHSTPLHARRQDGFACAVMLPRGTHDPIDFVPEKGGEAKLMHRRNTWLLAHPDDPVNGGARHCGLLGRNIELKTP